MIVPFSGIPLAVFVGLTLIIGGGAAVMTGRAIAGTWRPFHQLVFACVGIGAAERFLAYGLFDGPLFSLSGYLMDTAIIAIIGSVAYRLYWVANVVRQYPWRYERAGPWRYRERRQQARAE